MSLFIFYMDIYHSFLFCSVIDNNDFIKDTEARYYINLSPDDPNYLFKYFVFFDSQSDITNIYERYKGKFILYELSSDEFQNVFSVFYGYGLLISLPALSIDYKPFSNTLSQYIFNTSPESFVRFIQNHFPDLTDNFTPKQLEHKCQQFISEYTSTVEWTSCDMIQHIVNNLSIFLYFG